jgi:hypothetical protein
MFFFIIIYLIIIYILLIFLFIYFENKFLKENIKIELICKAFE